MTNKQFIDRVGLVIFIVLYFIIPLAGIFTAVAHAEDKAWPGGPTVPDMSYLRVGAIIGSDHLSNGDWNEDQNGLYVGFNGWAVGQYENSYSKINGRDKLMSSFITYEIPIYRKNWVETSFTVGFVDGYPEEATTFKRSTIPWVSVNIRFGGDIGVKLWHVPTAVTAYGVEYRTEVK